MKDVPPLWSGPPLALVRCHRCGGQPFRLLPGQFVWCWKCRHWLGLAHGTQPPKGAPGAGLWDAILARITRTTS